VPDMSFGARADRGQSRQPVTLHKSVMLPSCLKCETSSSISMSYCLSFCYLFVIFMVLHKLFFFIDKGI